MKIELNWDYDTNKDHYTLQLMYDGKPFQLGRLIYNKDDDCYLLINTLGQVSKINVDTVDTAQKRARDILMRFHLNIAAILS